MTPCLSEMTTLSATFAEDVQAFVAAGCRTMEIWLTKLEKHLDEHSPESTRKLLSDAGIEPVAASYQGGLLLSQGDSRRAHFDHFRRRLEICSGIGIRRLLIAADFAPGFTQADLERATVSLAQAGQWAAGSGVRLGLEFRGGDAFCSNLDTALRLVAASGESNIGVNFDVFHYYKGPSKSEDLDRLTPDNLTFVQVCDLSGVPRELATDADRILPGDGDLPLQPLLKTLRDRGYDGPVSLELMNPTLWQLKPSQVAELGMAALRRILPD